MVRTRLRSAVLAAVLLTGLGTGPAAASAAPADAAPAAGVPVPAGGRGAATATAVAVRAPHPAAQPGAGVTGSIPAAPAAVHRTLGRGGAPVGSGLTGTAAAGTRPAAPAVARSGDGGANAGSTGPPGATGSPPGGAPAGPATSATQSRPRTVYANVNGIDQAGGGGAPTSSANAAVGRGQIVQVVNSRITVYSRNGVGQCSAPLATLLGAGETLFDPRVQYDNVANRYSIVVSLVPASGSAVPALYVMASLGGDACGSWWRYRVTFSGPLFPAGTLLDYPYLGQERAALLLSTNNFRSGYRSSTVFAIAKSALYTGRAFSFPVFAAGFSTAPVAVGGVPMASTGASYFLSAVPGTGYRLYRMTGAGGAGATFAPHATVRAAYSAPTRRVRQCATAATLDPFDGRIGWQPVQIGNFVWFTHGVDSAGFPTVRYGAIRISDGVPFLATAYRSATSDDFNPSIGVSDAGGNGNHVWLNWAYTDVGAAACRNATVVVDGVGPGGGVPNLVGTGVVLATGPASAASAPFGEYSSVSVEPVAASGTCPAGRSAVITQQYFGQGGWRTRIARLGFC